MDADALLHAADRIPNWVIWRFGDLVIGYLPIGLFGDWFIW
jgi:hypothetical protein